MKPNFNQNYKGIRCRVYLVNENGNDERISLCNSSDVYELVRDELASSDRERLLSIMLTTKNDLIGVETVYIGSMSSCIITPKDVMKAPLLANAASIILCHNHPSGDLEPSSADLQITKVLIEAGELLGIRVLDHLIVTNSGYKSLREDNDEIKFPN